MARIKKSSDSYTAYARGGVKMKTKKMASGGKTPTTPKEKAFAALADPKDKITAADRITGAKKSAGTARGGKKVAKAKSGAALKKQAATAIAMKKAGKAPKKMMGGGKCRGGCY